MKLKEVLNPIDGFFSNMPQDIWGDSLDPSLIDVELFTRIGNLEISPLTEFYVSGNILNVTPLSNLLYQRYHANWSRMWDALSREYDIMLTSTMEEERTIDRTDTQLETRDLTSESVIDGTVADTTSQTNVKDGSLSRSGESELAKDTTDTETRALNRESTIDGTVADTSSQTNVKSGSVTTAGTSEVEKDLTDTETRATTHTEKETGTEGLTDTFNKTIDTDDTLTYSGSKKLTNVGTEQIDSDETTTFTGSENIAKTDKETRGLTKKNSGTVGTDSTTHQTGNGTKTSALNVYGVGGAGPTPKENTSDSETRNFTDTVDSTRTDNLTETDNGTIDHAGSENKSFVGRSDATVGNNDKTINMTETESFTGRTDKTDKIEKESGTVKHDTTFGKQTAVTDGGTVTTTQEGTESTTDSNTETFNNVTDTGSGSNTSKEDRVESSVEGGTVTNKAGGTETTTDEFTETYNDIKDTLNGSTNSKEDKTITDKEGGTVNTAGSGNVTEKFKSQGSSPLRTYQALIQEEIDGRKGQGWNFTNLIIEDVQTLIVQHIWKREFNVSF